MMIEYITLDLGGKSYYCSHYQCKNFYQAYDNSTTRIMIIIVILQLTAVQYMTKRKNGFIKNALQIIFDLEKNPIT